MRERSTRLLLLFVVVLTTFSFFVTWPSNPKRYLPDFIPWPVEDCVGGICIGKGIDIFGIERREMRLGLDLRGGTRLVLEADISGQPDVDLNEALDTAVDVVERRVNAFGVAESITERVGANRLSVQLPGISSDEAVEKIGRTAQLQFMELAKDASGNVVINQPDGTKTTQPLASVLANPVLVQAAEYVPVAVVDDACVQRELSGAYLDRGDIFVDRNAAGLPQLNFGMNSEGAKLLGQATERLSALQEPMAFFLDGEPIRGGDGEILAPRVRARITDRGVIDGLTLGDAQKLATLLRRCAGGSPRSWRPSCAPAPSPCPCASSSRRTS